MWLDNSAMQRSLPFCLEAVSLAYWLQAFASATSCVAAAGERGFHIFYSLLEGSNDKLKAKLRIADSTISDYRYTAESAPPSAAPSPRRKVRRPAGGEEAGLEASDHPLSAVQQALTQVAKASTLHPTALHRTPPHPTPPQPQPHSTTALTNR